MDLYNLVVSAKLTKGGGGGDEPVLIDKSIDANGTYKASDDSADGYKKVIVSVPSSGIVPSGTKDITSNGLYDVTNFSQASVSVPGIVPSGTSSITSNGIYDITSFASVDVNVSGGGGDHDAEDGIITKEISGAYYNDRVTRIAANTFYSCKSLTAAGFPMATRINASAFANCTSLTSISFPSVTSIGTAAFYGCTSLTSISFPSVTEIEANAFYGCSRLAAAGFPMATRIGVSAFAFCSSLTSISFPSATSISASAFYGCTSLTSIYFLAESVAKLSSATAFYNTPMSDSTYTGSFGSIYVPASLVDSYKASTHWSKFSDRITAYVE